MVCSALSPGPAEHASRQAFANDRQVAACRLCKGDASRTLVDGSVGTTRTGSETEKPSPRMAAELVRAVTEM
jgi:hypothetical protein